MKALIIGFNLLISTYLGFLRIMSLITYAYDYKKEVKKMKVRKVRCEQKRDELVKEYIDLGCTVIEEEAGITKMTKFSVGGWLSHIIILIFTGWWTFGIVNIVWAIINFMASDDVEIEMSYLD